MHDLTLLLKALMLCLLLSGEKRAVEEGTPVFTLQTISE